MIDFFHKGAAMTKRITGTAKMVGAPEIHSRPKWNITMVGTFMDEGDDVSRVLLEVADTEETRRRGMMGRSNMPEVCGMLFDGLQGGGYFWMKDCLVGLDIAFLDRNGYVTKTYTMPVDKAGTKHYEYDDDDVSAVEVAEGYMKRHGIVPGFRFAASPLSKEVDNG